MRAIAGARKPKKPLPPRVLGEVAFPVRRLIEGFRLERGGNDRELHYVRAKRVAAEKLRTWQALGLYPKAPPFPLVVTVVRIAPALLDTDNLIAGAKAVRDAVAHWLGVDDGKAERDGLVEWRVTQRKAGKGAYHVELRIEPVGLTLAAELDAIATAARAKAERELAETAEGVF